MSNFIFSGKDLPFFKFFRIDNNFVAQAEESIFVEPTNQPSSAKQKSTQNTKPTESRIKLVPITQGIQQRFIGIFLINVQPIKERLVKINEKFVSIQGVELEIHSAPTVASTQFLLQFATPFCHITCFRKFMSDYTFHQNTEVFRILNEAQCFAGAEYLLQEFDESELIGFLKYIFKDKFPSAPIPISQQRLTPELNHKIVTIRQSHSFDKSSQIRHVKQDYAKHEQTDLEKKIAEQLLTDIKYVTLNYFMDLRKSVLSYRKFHPKIEIIFRIDTTLQVGSLLQFETIHQIETTTEVIVFAPKMKTQEIQTSEDIQEKDSQEDKEQ